MDDPWFHFWITAAGGVVGGMVLLLVSDARKPLWKKWMKYRKLQKLEEDSPKYFLIKNDWIPRYSSHNKLTWSSDEQPGVNLIEILDKFELYIGIDFIAVCSTKSELLKYIQIHTGNRD